LLRLFPGAALADPAIRLPKGRRAGGLLAARHALESLHRIFGELLVGAVNRLRIEDAGIGGARNTASSLEHVLGGLSGPNLGKPL
jgi:hypothetical protein